MKIWEVSKKQSSAVQLCKNGKVSYMCSIFQDVVLFLTPTTCALYY